MSERSYCPSAKRDALSNKLQTANREPCDSLRPGLCGGLSSYPRSRLSDHIKNLQRFPDTLGGMKSSLATRKLAVEANAGCRGCRDSPCTETVSGTTQTGTNPRHRSR